MNNTPETPAGRRQRLYLLRCLMSGDVEMDQKQRHAKEKYRYKIPLYSSTLHFHNPTNSYYSVKNSKLVYTPANTGQLRARRMYLCDKSRNRTVIHYYKESMDMSE